MAEIIVPVVAASVVIYKGVEILTKKSYKKFSYKKLKKTIYKIIKTAFDEEDVEKLKEGIDMLRDFDEKNGKDKLSKMLKMLDIDEEKINTLEEIAEQFDKKHDKENEKSKIINDIDEYFDNIKSEFMKKINNTLIKE